MAEEIVDGDDGVFDADDSWKEVADEEEDGVQLQSLLDDSKFADLDALIEHDKETHGFDLAALITRESLSFYDAIRLVNWFRRQDGSSADKLAALEAGGLADVKDEDNVELMKPAVEGDALLTQIGVLVVEDEEEDVVEDEVEEAGKVEEGKVEEAGKVE